MEKQLQMLEILNQFLAFESFLQFPCYCGNRFGNRATENTRESSV